MNKRILPIILVLSLLVTLAPVGVYAQTAEKEDRPALQGEIAYVHDGDIWLLDLFSNESRRLTEDGGNRWPSWSDDGRYLLYTHEKYRGGSNPL